MEIALWINLIYTVLHWVILLLVLDLQRIKQLAPIGLIAVVILLVPQTIAISLGLFEYPKDIFKIFGQPFFQYPAIFAYGILLISFMKEPWLKKLPIIAIFTIITEIELYIASLTGNFKLINWSYWLDLILTFAGYCLGVWLAERMFKKRLNHS